MESKKVPVSVVILTKNEEEKIEDCLKSVWGWVDEIIVVDDESTDRTREIASKYADRVLVKKMDIEGKHRNWAYSQAKNDWILSLDADEVVTEELKKEIIQLMNSNLIEEYNAFAIPRRNFLGNRWIRYGGFYPSAQLKLFRKDKFRWEEAEVHPRAFLEGKCGRLKKDLLHYTYKDFSDVLKKLNHQTTLEAKKWFRIYKENPKKAHYKMNFFHVLWRMLDRFIRSFIIKKGFKDGFLGFVIAVNSSLYQLLSYVKYKELRENYEK